MLSDQMIEEVIDRKKLMTDLTIILVKYIKHHTQNRNRIYIIPVDDEEQLANLIMKSHEDEIFDLFRSRYLQYFKEDEIIDIHAMIYRTKPFVMERCVYVRTLLSVFISDFARIFTKLCDNLFTIYVQFPPNIDNPPSP